MYVPEKSWKLNLKSLQRVWEPIATLTHTTANSQYSHWEDQIFFFGTSTTAGRVHCYDIGTNQYTLNLADMEVQIKQ